MARRVRHRDLVDRAQQTERAAPLLVPGEAVRDLGPGPARLRRPLAGPPRDRDLALAGRDRHRGLADHAAAGAAAVADLGEERDVAEPDVAGDVDLAAVLHREHRQAVDVAGARPGVVDRRD